MNQIQDRKVSMSKYLQQWPPIIIMVETAEKSKWQDKKYIKVNGVIYKL